MEETAGAPEAAAAPGDAALVDPGKQRLLLVNVLVVAMCALIYELVCGTLASYLLGDAVLQFSLVLGTYLFAMGVGAWVSRRLEPRAASRYVQTELVLALVGGLSVPMLLLAVEAHVPVRPAIHGVVFTVGVLVGVELPLLVRILRGPKDLQGSSETRNREGAGNFAEQSSLPRIGSELPSFPVNLGTGRDARRFGDVVARAFAYDYVGALGASLLFPLLLVPRLGLVRTSVVTGAVNALVALSATFVVRVERPGIVRAACVLILAVLAVTFVRGEAWVAGATD